MVDLHRRIALAPDGEALARVASEVADRFGEPPPPVEALFEVQRLRILLRQAGARQASARSGRIVIGPVPLDSAAMRALRDGVDGALYSTADSLISVPAPAAPAERIAAAIAALEAVAQPAVQAA